MELMTRHQLRPASLNHHRTLYAGQIADWMTEAAFLCAVRLWGRTDHIVMVAADGLRITRSARLGDVLELYAEVSALGTTSISLNMMGREMLSGEECCTGRFVFVTIDDEGKKCAHGLTMP